MNFSSALSLAYGEVGIDKIGGKSSSICKLLHGWGQHHSQSIHLFEKYLSSVY